MALRELREEDVRAVLPHRGRMLLLRGAEVGDGEPRGRASLRIDEGAWGAGLSCPHLYVVEALAQLAGLALAAAAGGDDRAGPVLGYLAEVPGVRFGAVPQAGDEVALAADLEISFGPLTRFRVSARRGEEEVLLGTLTVAVAGP